MAELPPVPDTYKVIGGGLTPIEAGSSGAPSSFPSALGALGVGPAQATRLLRSARRGIGPITGVLASPLTLSRGTTGAVSLINGNSVNQGAGRYNVVTNPEIEAVGGIFTLLSASSAYTIKGATNLLGTSVLFGHGSGIRFASDAQVFDFCCTTNSGTIIIYVTDLTNGGVRQRITANDVTTSGGFSYYSVDAGSAALRIWEIYGQRNAQMSFRGLNVAAQYSIFKAPSPDFLKVALVGDSWIDGVQSGGTNPDKLTVTDFMLEVLGAPNPVLSGGISGSGFVNTAGGQGNFVQRLQAGDLSVANIGAVDLVDIPCSLNDNANADAVVSAAITQGIQLAMAAQPSALIVSNGPQYTTNFATPQSRYDVSKAAFLAAANGDPRCIWLDSSPSGENWLNAGNVGTYIGADGTHCNDLGLAYYGRRKGVSLLNAVRAQLTL